MGAVHKHSARQAHVGGRRTLRGRALALSCATVVVGVATLMMTTSPAQAAARRHHDSLSGVSCVGPSYCVAVGTYQHSNVQYALAEQWNGHRWSVMNTGPGQPFMSGVSCVAVGDCWAVGNYYGEPSIEHLVGGTWEGGGLQPSVLGFLYGISCVPTACFAVGDEYDQGGYDAITVQGNGLGPWNVSSSNPNFPPSSGFAGVSCSSAADCMAVGNTEYYATPPPNVTFGIESLIGSWDGSTWAIAPISGTQSSLSGVSCDGPLDCMAVGGGLIEHWDGSAWSTMSAPPLANLDAVSCVSPTDCTAVGSGSETAHWDGTTWSVEQSPTPKRSTSSVLTGLSCTNASNCLAVGDYVKKSSAQVNLTEQWNGTAWAIVKTPNR